MKPEKILKKGNSVLINLKNNYRYLGEILDLDDTTIILYDYKTKKQVNISRDWLVSVCQTEKQEVEE